MGGDRAGVGVVTQLVPGVCLRERVRTTGEADVRGRGNLSESRARWTEMMAPAASRSPVVSGTTARRLGRATRDSAAAAVQSGGRFRGRAGAKCVRLRASASSAQTEESKKSNADNKTPWVTSNEEEEEDGLEHTYERLRWLDIRDEVRPTQVALGWDWTFYKLANFKDFESAKAYMERKPVPYVSYRGLRYVVDHHHTLAALQLAGWDVDIYMEQIFEYDDDLSEERFWGIMEGKGWSFCWDSDYSRLEHDAIPTSFDLTSFRNDIFRSLGGFCRKQKLLKRGKMLEEKLFFEFQWGYFFWLHRNDAYALWPSSQLQRGFNRLLTMIEQTDDSEYIGEGHLEASRDVKDMILLSDKVLQPLYEVLVRYVAPLAYAYATLPTNEERVVPGLKKRFGREILPGSVITGHFDFMTERQNFIFPSDDNVKKEKKDKSSEKKKKDS